MSERIEALLARMDARDRIGQLVMGLNSPDLPALSAVEDLIPRLRLGSILTADCRTLDARANADYNATLQRLALGTPSGIPLLNGGDFEQGLASQIPLGTTPLPQQMGLAATGDPLDAHRAAELAGREARELGFHWLFVPVADVNVNPANPVIGVRAFGDDPDLVARLTEYEIAGFHSVGVAAMVKHFPGHGAANVDSHLGLPTITCDRAEFERVHLAPFRAAIRAGVDSMMTAHVVVPWLDPDLPATLSPRILTGLLRDELGFDGVVVTDLMSMQVIAARWSPGEAAVQAIRAGADIVMAAVDTAWQVVTVEALLRAYEDGTLPSERVEESVRRVLQLKEECRLFDDPLPDPALAGRTGNAARQSFAAGLCARSITLLRNDNILPWDLHRAQRTLVASVPCLSARGVTPVEYASPVAGLIREIAAGEAEVWVANSMDPSDDEIAGAVERVYGVDRVVILTYARGELTPGQAHLAEALATTGKALVAISLGTPYDLAAYPTVPAAIATYALSFVPRYLTAPGVLEAAVRVLFGAPAPGVLPVVLPSPA